MPAVADTVRVEFEAKWDKYIKENQKNAHKFDQMMAGMQNSAQRTERATIGMGRTLARVFSVAAAGLVIRQTVRMADAWTNAENALAAVEQTIGRTTASMSEIADVATETRSSFEGTVTLYSRLERAASELGRSQEDVLRVTELVNKAFIAGGSSSSEQRSSILQLSQGIASGALQGEELRSIRENAPLVAQAIADAMGVSIGALRDLGAEGRITGDIILQAMLNAGDEIERQFNATRMTVGQAMTNLQTAALEAVGGMDDASGATAGMARAIDDLARTIRENKEGLAEFAGLLAQIAGFGVAGVSALGNISQYVSETLSQGMSSPQSLNEIRQEMEALLELAAEYDRRAAVGGRHTVNIGRLRGSIGQAAIDRITQETGDITSAEAALEIVEALNYRFGELAVRMRNLRSAADEFTPDGRPIETPVSAEDQAARDRLEAQLELSLALLANDVERARELEDQLDLMSRIAAYEKAGYDLAEARTRAESDQTRLVEAREQAMQRELRLARRAVDLEVAQAAENQQAVEALEREADFQERINRYREYGLSVDEAIQQAVEDTHRIEEARLSTRRRMLSDARLAHEITLAELAGQEELARTLQMQEEIEARRRRYRDEGGLDDSAAAERARGEVKAEEAARIYGEHRSIFARAFSDGIRAAMSGDLRGFLLNSLGTIADEGLRRAGEKLFDALFDAPVDTARAAAQGLAQGQAAGTAMGTSITVAGQSAATTMAAAIRAAGAQAAAAMASAVGAGSTASGAAKTAKAFAGFFGSGGTMSPGQYGYVGEAGMERAFALPGGGVRIEPMGSKGGAAREIIRDRVVFVGVDKSEYFDVKVQEAAEPAVAAGNARTLGAISKAQGEQQRATNRKLKG